MKKIYLVFILLAGLALMGQGCISFGKGGGNAGTDGGIFKSADKGETWAQKVAVAAVKPAAANNVNVVTIVFDPQDSKTIYLGTAENGLFYTTDAAESWLQVGAISSGRVGAIAIDSKDKCNVYAAIGNRIFKTSDCTRTWQNIYVDTRADQVVLTLASDSYNPATIYAGLSGGDLLKSTDSGASWTVIKRFENPVAKILVNYYDTRILYVGTERAGLWKSTDSGATWNDINEKLKEYGGAKEFKNMALDFSKRDSLVLASKYGLLRTSDGGTNWEPINLLTPPGSVEIYSLALNPQNGNEIYYGTASTLYKTTDGGIKWVTRKLPTTRAATYMLVDPGNGNLVYLGTTKFKQ
jgi:photosystem II stability/assembly factor-like uncharacterized protein